MAKPSSSPLEQINSAIKSQNIFKNIGVFRSDNVWGRGYPDVASFNAHASDTVFQALEQVRQDQTHKVTSLVFTATQGQGKTHLINRIRRRLINEDNTVFIYAHVLNFTDLNQVNFHFQQTVVDSLSRSNAEDVTQWQTLATSMINNALVNVKPRLPKTLINKFDKTYKDYQQQGKDLIDNLRTKIKIPTNINPYIVRAVLWTLSARFSSYAEKWLAGEVLEASHAKDLGIPPSIHSNENQESSALNVVQQIFNLIGHYSSIIICFDEIDTGENYSNDGLRAPQVVAVLVKSLYDTLEQSRLSKGVIILTVMMPDTYRDLFSSMADGGISDRLCTFTQKKPIELNFLNAKSMIELVRLHLTDFYSKRELVPPEPTYPFNTEQLKKYVKVNRPTMREAINWCAENFKVENEVLPENPSERIELALSRESESDFSELIEDSAFVAHVLRFGFTVLIGECISGTTATGDRLNNVIIQDVVDVLPKSKNNDWINFKIIGTEREQVFKIGVMVLQQTHGLSIVAGMNRIIDYQTFDLTRGCLVRPKDKKIKRHWDSYKLLTKLIKKQGGEWVYLNLQDLNLLIKLYTVNEQKDAYCLTDEQIRDYTKQRVLKNALLLEILSRPSGGIDESSIEVDDPFEDSSTLSEIDEIEQLENLFGDDEENDEIVDVENHTDNFVKEDNTPEVQIEEHEQIPQKTAVQSVESATTIVDSGVLIDMADTLSTNVELPLPKDVAKKSRRSKVAKLQSNPSATPSPETWFTRDYRGINITSFTFNNIEYEVTTWRELLITICTLIKLHHNKDFAKILEIRGRKNSYFSKNAADLKTPEKIYGSGIYVETYLSANQIVKMVHRIITTFSYAEDSLEIQTHE